MTDLFGYFKAVATAWRGYIGIFTLALTLIARTIPGVERRPWFAYVGPLLIGISIVLLLWAMYAVYHSLLVEMRLAQSHLADRERMRYIRLRKLLHELSFNQDHLGSEPSYWRDDAWRGVDEALPILPADLLKDIQAYYMELRSARDAGSYSPPRIRHRKNASSKLPPLLGRLRDFIDRNENTGQHGGSRDDKR